MLTVRCSTRLLKDVGQFTPPEPASPDSSLGDWYATTLQLRPMAAVMLVEESTRLAVVMPSRDFSAPGGAIAEAILKVLGDLGVDPQALERERLAMAEVAFARFTSRGMTSSANEHSVQLEALIERQPRVSGRDASAKLAQLAIAIPGHGFARPADVVRQRLAQSHA